MEKAYRVNIDFELQVRHKTDTRLKPAWQREWEYLFWWIEAECRLLASDPSSYHDEDIKYFKEKTNRDQLFIKSDTVINWWGDPLNHNNMQKTDLPALRERVYGDLSSSQLKPESFPCVIKTNGTFGGKGIYFLDSINDYKKRESYFTQGEYIVEPYRQIELDFSYYCFEKSLVYYRSNVSASGEYRGSLFSQSLDWLPQKEMVLDQTQKLMNTLKTKNMGVDCYFYLENHQLRLEPLCEINSRRTIASCSFEIYQKYYSEYSYAQSLLIPMKQVKNKKDFNNLKVVRLSPRHGQYFYHALILGDSEEELVNLSDQLQKFLNRS